MKLNSRVADCESLVWVGCFSQMGQQISGRLKLPVKNISRYSLSSVVSVIHLCINFNRSSKLESGAPGGRYIVMRIALILFSSHTTPPQKLSSKVFTFKVGRLL